MIQKATIWIAALLYAGFATFANPAMAEPNVAALTEMRQGDMRKLVFHTTPRGISPLAFQTADGTEKTLAAYQGKTILLNFWATWCAPCREEMPELDALNAELGGAAFEVVTISTGGDNLKKIKRFFTKAGVSSLPILIDDSSNLSRNMGAFGLPTTVIINPDGKEIARMQGEAHWNSENARALISAILEGYAGS